MCSPKERVRGILSIVGLSKVDAETRFQEYSTGMKQKLALARTLLPDPSILLLDDLTVGLDVQTAIKLRNFVRETLNREMGKTVLFTTHNMREAELLCDKLAVISRGKVIKIGSPEEIKKVVKSSIKIRLVVYPKKVREKLLKINGVLEVKEEKKNGFLNLEILIQEKSDLSSILRIISNQTRILRVSTLEPSLEEAFLRLTEGYRYDQMER